MRNAKAVKQFTDSLSALQGMIALFPKGGSELLLTFGYPGFYRELETIRNGLEDIGLYEIILEAIKRSELLTREGSYDEAEMIVLEANRKLSRASGRDEDFRRMYKASND